jgi:Ni/Co efflux regulator RcnB
MKTLVLAVAATALLVGGVANAQPNSQPSYQILHSYNRGERIEHDDWSRGQPVDYRAQHLRAPPRGYEWREVNGQYILAAVATGVIMSIILNAGH